MKTKIGLWIDHQRAVIVSFSHKGEEIKILESNINKYFKNATGYSHNIDFGRKDFPSYDILQRDREMHIKKFYDNIISSIHNVDSIFIFGPGEAKTELKKCIEMNRSMTKNIEIEPADKMTDINILKKIRQHFMIHA